MAYKLLIVALLLCSGCITHRQYIQYGEANRSLGHMEGLADCEANWEKVFATQDRRD